MKNQMIREAWDTVNPTPAQKDRMRAVLEAHMEVSKPAKPKSAPLHAKPTVREELPVLDFTLPDQNPYKKRQQQEPDPQKKHSKRKPQPRYYSQKPSRKKDRFGSFAAVAAMLMVVTAVGLFLGVMRGTVTDDDPQPLAAPTETAQVSADGVVVPDTGDSQYNGVLQKYVDAINQNWSQERYFEADISAHIYEDNALDALGWCLMDVDGNGQEELLISDGETLYDGYTIDNGGVSHFLTANDNDQWQLCVDGIFYCFSTVDGKSFWTFYKPEDECTLQPIKTVVYDEAGNTYYAGQTETSAQPISKDEAGALIVTAYPRTTIPVTLFQAGENELPAEYQTLIDKYIQAIEEGWSGERLSQEEMSILVRDVPSLNELGYAQTDLDGDGFTELIITDGYVIYDLYTRFHSTDRQLTHVFSSFERILYYLSNDGVLCCEGSNSAASGEYRFSRLEDGVEYLIERLEYEYTVDADGKPVATWFRYGPGDLSEQLSVAPSTANEIIAKQYPRIFIPHTTFAGENRSTEYAVDENILAAYAENISTAFENYGKAEEKTFCFHDIDDDGNDELLLGGGNTIYRILQPKRGSGETIRITAPVGNTGYAYLCEGNVIRCDAFAQGNNHYEFIKIGDSDGSGANEIDVVDYVFYSPDTESWYIGGAGINTPISDEDAEAVFEKYPEVGLNWKPISEFPVAIGEMELSGTPLFEQVFMPVATGEVSNRLEDVTALVEDLGYTWRTDEGVLECIDHDAAHGTLTAYLTNVNGYEEVFDLTYINKYGENEEDCRKATVTQLEGKDIAYYIGTDTVIYVGAVIVDPNDFRSFVFGDDESLMLKALATQFAVAYFSHDDIYMEDAVSSDCTLLDRYTGEFTSYKDFGEIQGLPASWDGSPVTVSVPCILPPDTDSYSYLTMEFVKENGLWKVSSYGLEK